MGIHKCPPDDGSWCYCGFSRRGFLIIVIIVTNPKSPNSQTRTNGQQPRITCDDPDDPYLDLVGVNVVVDNVQPGTRKITDHNSLCIGTIYTIGFAFRFVLLCGVTTKLKWTTHHCTLLDIAVVGCVLDLLLGLAWWAAYQRSGKGWAVGGNKYFMLMSFYSVSAW